MDWQSVGVAAIGAALILDRVFGFLKGRNGTRQKVELTLSPALEQRLLHIERQSRELHEAHLGLGSRDQSGHFRWQNRDDVTRATLDACTEAKKQTTLLGECATVLHKLAGD
jgi:hypothetical protein